jgi:hypothetical protein
MFKVICIIAYADGIVKDGESTARKSMDFGRGVTKQRVYDPAEYRTLIGGLKDPAGRIHRAGKSPSGYSLLVHTDFRLMVGQLAQGWKIKAADLRPLVDEAAALFQTFIRGNPSAALGTGLVKVPLTRR